MRKPGVILTPNSGGMFEWEAIGSYSPQQKSKKNTKNTFLHIYSDMDFFFIIVYQAK